MKTSTSDALNLTDMLGMWSNHRGLIVLGTLLSGGLFTTAAILLPQRFKSHFTMAIHSSYFQNPLTRDLTQDIYDSAEMRSQRESIIRQALTPDFIDRISEKYGIYQSANNGWLRQFLQYYGLTPNVDEVSQQLRSRSQQRQELMGRINITNLNNETFQVSFIYTNPDIAFHVMQDLHTQVSRGIADFHRANLISLHNAIQKRIDSLSASLPKPKEGSQQEFSSALAAPSDAPALTSPRRVEEELAEIRSELRVMAIRYTPEHPLVKELREKEKALSAMSSANGYAGLSRSLVEPLSVRVPADAAIEMYKDLTRKLNYLNISFESDQTADVATIESPVYPSAPLGPPKSLMVLWGLCAGLLGSLFIAALREYFDRATLHASDFAQELGLPYFGGLPVVHWGAAFPKSPKSGSALHKVPTWI